jgi:hypothetical protein
MLGSAGEANKWKGLLFGMTNRCGWNGHDPNGNSEIWRVFDAFGIVEADMYGWWNSSARPVGIAVAGAPSGLVLATAYVRPGHGALVAIASWATAEASASLRVSDWATLGLDPAHATATSVLVPPHATNTKRPHDAAWAVAPGQGLVLHLASDGIEQTA